MPSATIIKVILLSWIACGSACVVACTKSPPSGPAPQATSATATSAAGNRTELAFGKLREQFPRESLPSSSLGTNC